MSQDKISKFNSLSGTQLVTIYNAMAEQLGIAEVKRFSDAKAGVRRCEELREKLDAAGIDPERKETEEPVASATEPLQCIVVSPPVVESAPMAEVSSEGKLQPMTDNWDCHVCLALFHARAGTIREKILRLLCKSLNNQVALPDLIEAGYGANGAAGAAAIQMVLKGVKWMIEKHKLKIELRRTYSGKIQYYGLHQIADQIVSAGGSAVQPDPVQA